ncbi:hypothetical protein WMF38_21275 [Sorangium sp. So ce118]
MSFNIQDPKRRIALTFPGRPVTRRVSPGDVERYLRERGYEAHRLDNRNWPLDVIYSWWPPRRPPRWPDPRATSIDVQPRPVREFRECCKSLEQAIETIAHNEGRTPGEVLREIAVLAQVERDE